MAGAATVEKQGKSESKEAVTPTPQATPPKAKKYRFRLMRGMYVSTEYTLSIDPETKEKKRVANHTTYQADPKKGVFPVIDTDEDLERFNGEHSGMKKFERIHGSATQVVTDPTKRLEGETLNAYHKRMEDLQRAIKNQFEETIKGLDKMTQDQLVAIAQQEEIDISACKTVGDVRQTIRDSLFS